MRRAAAIHGPLAIGALAVCWLFAVPARRESAAQAQAPPAQLFRDITRDSGVTFQHHADPEKKYIVESMSGGLALFDFDNDGLLDIYFVDSLTVETAGNPRAARSTLYRNRGKGRFDDVTDKAGVGHPGWGMGVCTADVDGDGWEDLYVTAIGGNKFYRNNRDGTFADLTAAAGLTAGGWSAGCGFADYDRDGDLDLFVARYVKIDLANLPQFGKDKTCEYRGIAVQCGPRGLPGESDFLFRNEGNGKFSDVSQHAGVSDPREYFGLGIAWFDYDEDGWLDLYVANDSTPNYLYHNQKNGTFKEIAFPMGVAVSQDGAEQGQHGRRDWRLRQQRPPERLGDELLGGIQRALPQQRRSLHRRIVSVEDSGCQPAICRVGQRVLRLRQRRAARHDRRQRSCLSAARQGAASRICRIPAAQTPLPQSRQRHVRRGGTDLWSGHHGRACQPRAGRRRSRR